MTTPNIAKVAACSRSRMPSPATLVPARKRGMAWPSLEIISLSHRPARAEAARVACRNSEYSVGDPSGSVALRLRRGPPPRLPRTSMTTAPSRSVRRVRHAVRGERRQRRRRRMPVGVVLADRDHRQPRRRPFEQAVEARVLAAVVGDLEHVDRTRVDRGRLGLGVGAEQHREAAPAGDGDQRQAIGVLACVGAVEQRRRRPDEVEVEAARAQAVAGGDPARRHARGGGLPDQPAAGDPVEQASRSAARRGPPRSPRRDRTGRG